MYIYIYIYIYWDGEHGDRINVHAAADVHPSRWHSVPDEPLPWHCSGTNADPQWCLRTSGFGSAASGWLSFADRVFIINARSHALRWAPVIRAGMRGHGRSCRRQAGSGNEVLHPQIATEPWLGKNRIIHSLCNKALTWDWQETRGFHMKPEVYIFWHQYLRFQIATYKFLGFRFVGYIYIYIYIYI